MCSSVREHFRAQLIKAERGAVPCSAHFRHANKMHPHSRRVRLMLI